MTMMTTIKMGTSDADENHEDGYDDDDYDDDDDASDDDDDDSDVDHDDDDAAPSAFPCHTLRWLH